MFLLLGTLLSAQTVPTVEQIQFTLNFQVASATTAAISFQKENNQDGSYDLIVLQKGEPLFRFSHLENANETPVTFALITDKEAAMKHLTQVKNDDLAEIMSDFSNYSLAYIGYLECKTPNGAKKRMQVATYEEEEEEAITIR
jgi:hypothetical protein